MAEYDVELDEAFAPLPPKSRRQMTLVDPAEYAQLVAAARERDQMITGIESVLATIAQWANPPMIVRGMRSRLKALLPAPSTSSGGQAE